VSLKNQRHPGVEVARCSGCGRCVAACPERLFTLEVSGFRKHAVLGSPERCTLCLDCLAACPVQALDLPGKDAAPEVKEALPKPR
jgi:ferredoxin